MTINANHIVGTHDIVMVIIDSLRHDVAVECMAAGRTPNLAAWLPDGWEVRHTPGSFTFAAHLAFFAGFFPTPAEPGRCARLFAVDFPGSRTTGPETCVFDAPDIVTGLGERGYRTVSIGGTGFFNTATPLGRVLPSMFAVHHWRRSFGVQEPRSAGHQVATAVEEVQATPADQRLLLFVNISAVHAPNHFYLPDGPRRDSRESHAAALEYVDRELPPLIDAVCARGPVLAIFGSDHGEAYGEDGYRGHRISHPTVWTVPWAEVLMPGGEA